MQRQNGKFWLIISCILSYCSLVPAAAMPIEGAAFILKDGREVLLRTALPSDIEKLTVFFTTVFSSRVCDINATIAREKNEILEASVAGNFGVIALAEEKIVGYVSLKATSEPTEYYGCWLGVDPEYRKQGMAKALLLYVIKQRPTLSSVVLHTRKVNTEARALYAWLGAVVSDEPAPWDCFLALPAGSSTDHLLRLRILIKRD